MRVFVVFLIFVISCQPSQKAINHANSESKIMMESTFLKKESPDKKYILFYKIDQQKNSPVKWITFFVVKAKDETIVRPQEGFAAEDIYWKDANTIALVAYKEVEQSSSIPNQNTNNNEIIIKL